MRIAVDADRAFVDAPTGTETYAAELLRRIPVLAPEHQFTYFVHQRVAAKLPDNVTVEVLRWPIRNLWHQLRLSIRLLRGKFDVLFVPAHTVPLLHPMPTVTTIHDLGFMDMPGIYGNRKLAHGVSGWLGEAALRVLSLGRNGSSELDYHRWSLEQALRCTTIITVSKFTKDRILARYLKHPPIVSIYNGLTRRISSAASPPVGYPYALFVGRLERKKNLVGMLRAFQQFLELEPHSTERLVLAGNPGEGFSEAQPLLSSAPLKDRVVLVGYLEDSELGNYLAHAQALLFLPGTGFGKRVGIGTSRCNVLLRVQSWQV